jgi:hypothetical protein
MVEPASNLRSAAQRAYGDAIRFHDASIYALSFPDNSFDAVLSVRVFHRLNRADAALAEMSRIIRPGGRVILSYANKRNPKRIAQFSRWGVGKPVLARRGELLRDAIRSSPGADARTGPPSGSSHRRRIRRAFDRQAGRNHPDPAVCLAAVIETCAEPGADCAVCVHRCRQAMKVVVGWDVDPVLPEPLSRRPETDIWTPLAQIDVLIETMGDDLPPITWLIRAEERVRFATGSYVSGYVSKERRWQWLVNRGHELGWYKQLMSFNTARGTFVFDASPTWLHEAHRSLALHFAVRATRTGWDYGSNTLFATLDTLGVAVDFSALPGNLGWYGVGSTVVEVDWTQCAASPYHPSPKDDQAAGEDALAMLEVPVAQFPNRALVWPLGSRGEWRTSDSRYRVSTTRLAY